MEKPIYLDFAATTEWMRVCAENDSYLTEQFSSPASRSHAYGWTAGGGRDARAGGGAGELRSQGDRLDLGRD
jgi:hypothetical protein